MVEWRYAIRRMHRPMERMVGLLTGADRVRFGALKQGFIDNHAAVPPQSIRRRLALRAALGTGEVAVDEAFAIGDAVAGRLFLPATPCLLSRFPFLRSIAASADMAASAAAALVGP